jgi:flavin-dependent dehydrogenase
MLVWKYPFVQGLDMGVNNIWLKPSKLYNDLGFDPNDRVAGWFHPLPDGVIIGASKYLYSPWRWDKLKQYLRPYLEKYIEIRRLTPVGEKKEIQGIGVLYNPNHDLKKNGLLQLGDARRISRPCTGYGFIPAIWHGLFGAVSTTIAFNDNCFSKLDKIAINLFNKVFLFNYSWEYCMQKLYMDGEWSNMAFIFKTVKEVLQDLPEGFFDRLTMTTFTRSDVLTSISRFAQRLMTYPQLLMKLPQKTKLEFIQNVLKNRILHYNLNYFPKN